MVHYQRGKIYTIRSHQTKEIYIGSTTQPLNQRLEKHKKDYDSWKHNDRKKHCTSFKILKYSDYYIKLLEAYPCSYLCELNKREGEHIKLKNCVNKNITNRTKHDWHQANRSEQLAKMKQRYQNNKESVLIKRKQYYNDNKIKISKKITCDYCNSVFAYSNKTNHVKTTMHINNFKAAYLECWGIEFTGTITSDDY